MILGHHDPYPIGEEGHRLICHKLAVLPVGCYENDRRKYHLHWYWHEEIELGFVHKGTARFSTQGQTMHLDAPKGMRKRVRKQRCST